METEMNINGQTFVMGTKDMNAEMSFVQSKGYSQHSIYQHSFGPVVNKSTYLNGWVGSDMRPQLKAMFDKGFQSIRTKALSPESGGAGTAGYALIPVYVDSRIVDQSRKYTPLTEIIPRVTNQGLTADYNIITAKGAAFTANPDAAMNENDDTSDRQTKSIKYLYSVGRTLGPNQAAMPSYIMEGFNPSGSGLGAGNVFSPAGAPNAKQLEVLMKARALKELEEDLILNGDSSSDATQFDGILTQQGTTNQKDLSSEALTWDDVEETVRYAMDDGGRPKLAVCDSATLTDLRKLMIDTFRYSPEQLVSGASLPFGVPPQLVLQTPVGPVPVIFSMYLNNASGSKQIFFLDTDFIELRVLQDMTYEDLAKTNDSSKFMLKIYECLICRATPFNSFIDNIL